MMNRNETIVPARPVDGASPANVPLVGPRSQPPLRSATGHSTNQSPLAELMTGSGRQDSDQTLAQSNTGLGGPSISHQQSESIGSIVVDVEEFARNWIGRVRQLIQRSSQLIERETLLAGAIARLDQQKAEWNKRTAAKEANLRDQAKLLTEAWLEVESERRKHIQGVSAAAVHSAGPISAVHQTAPSPQRPVQPAPPSPHASRPGGHDAAPTGQGPAPIVNTPPMAAPATPRPQPGVSDGPAPVLPMGDAAMATVQNAPVSAGSPIASPRHDDPQTCESAERQKRQRIEEFRRMQRSIQSNRNT